MKSRSIKSTVRPRRKHVRKTPKNIKKFSKSSKSSKSKNMKKKKQKGGSKSCSLGYAMVKGMNVPAINNVEGDLRFNDVYARLNGGNCKPVENVVNHPVLKTH